MHVSTIASCKAACTTGANVCAVLCVQQVYAAGMLKMVGGFLKSGHMVTVGLTLLGKSFEMCCAVVCSDLVEQHCVARAV